MITTRPRTAAPHTLAVAAAAAYCDEVGSVCESGSPITIRLYPAKSLVVIERHIASVATVTEAPAGTASRSTDPSGP